MSVHQEGMSAERRIPFCVFSCIILSPGAVGSIALDAMKIARAEVEKDWQARGFSCGLWVDPPWQIWGDYVHLTYHPGRMSR